MNALWIVLVLGVTIVALPDSPVSPVGTAEAEVCRAGDLDCHERKANCVLRTVTHPTDSAVCTQ